MTAEILRNPITLPKVPFLQQLPDDSTIHRRPSVGVELAVLGKQTQINIHINSNAFQKL